ncbi:MAG: cell envelope integrity protein CreD [Flavobacteriaceae bacterium]|nr:cell envelope integrity protein CreD [Flavobacteriaceae bacterium]
MEQIPQKQTGKFSHWLRTSITARMIMIKILILILLIPLAFIKELIREREYRQKDVISEINSKWGNNVILYGPILKVPYKTYKETSIYNEANKSYEVQREAILNYGYFFPETLNVNTKVNSREKKRNNFKSVVFTSEFDIDGTFTQPNFEIKKIKKEDILWEQTTLLIKTTNLKGIKSDVKMKINNSNYAFEASFIEKNNYANTLDILESSFIKVEDLPIGKDRNFNFKLAYNGSESIEIVPIGKITEAQMQSNWVDPSFIGNFLPQNDGEKVTENGFKANWKVLQVNRSFAQQSFNSIPNITSYAFGTKFIFPIDEYQKNERTAKYGFMVIALTFLFFFLIQTLSKIHIHPFQYLMIGIALTMFYTLLIAISEHSSFIKAYIIAGSAVIGLITLYSKSILKNFKFPILIGTSLLALYSFIFVIIQMENYALLVGSIGLFVILAIVMFISRKIDWQNG